jgi:cystathionine beta-synthase
VVVTPTAVAPDDPRSYYNVAKRLVEETPNAILANQYHNPENPRSHYMTTGPEIWQQTGGRVTDVVIGMGTGGTISGVGRYLKEQNPDIRVVGVDPVGSLLLETWQRGRLPDDVEAKSYKVEGIGEDFLPSTLDLSVIDDVIRIGDRESFLWARRLVKEEAIFAGGSSGAAIAAAMHYAQNLPPERLVVVILPDSGARYLSKLYDDQWMQENGFLAAEWSEAQLSEVLAVKPLAGLIAAHLEDRMTDVIAQMKTYDISQMPVLNSDSTLAGLVTEVDLLKHLLECSHVHSADETIAGIVCATQAIFPANAPIEAALPAILDGQVALVTEEDHPVGILTKIDVLDFIAQGIGAPGETTYEI